MEDTFVLSQLKEDEMKRPIARKVLGHRNIHYSRPMPACTGLPVFCGFGEARVGNDKHKGDVMPGIYRAPEVTFVIEWMGL